MQHRLRSKAAFWGTFANSLVMSWINEGFPLRWKDGPPPPARFPNHKSAYNHADFVDSAIAELLASQAAAEVADPPLVISPLGVVEGSKLRLVWDGTYVNNFVDCPTFKYETLAELPEILHPDDYMFTIDLKSGYHHLDMHPDAWRYLGFEWKNKYYVYTALPFGLNVACWAFTKLLRPLFRRWRAMGFRCTGYLDDSLHANSTLEGAHAQRRAVLSDLEAAGLLRSPTKCRLEPSHRQPYLGMEVDTVQQRILVPQAKAAAFLDLVKLVLDSRRVPVKQLQRVTGHLAAMVWAFGPVVRLYTRHLHQVVGTARAPTDYVKITAGAADELQFWLEYFDRFNGYKQLWTPTHIHTLVRTDAAGSNAFTFGGWGAWTRLNGQILEAAGRWRPEDAAGASSTQLELQAIWLALQSFNRGGDLCDQTILVQSDNQAVTALISNGGSRNRRPAGGLLHQGVRDLFWYCIDQRITLLAEWIPRERNEEADALSKLPDPDDWKLHPRIFAQLDADWGPHSVDLFASHVNHHLPTYYSLHHTPDTAGVNAFAFNWGARCWANPPFKLVGRVWRHAQACGASLTLVFPFWPSAPWWHQLLAADPAYFSPHILELRELPRAGDLFLPGSTGNALPRGKAPWRVLAARVNFRCRREGPLICVPPVLAQDPL